LPPAVAIARLLPRQLNHGLVQPGVALWPGLGAVCGAIQFQQRAGLALTQPTPGQHERHIAASL